jgi:hypothetical protein
MFYDEFLETVFPSSQVFPPQQANKRENLSFETWKSAIANTLTLLLCARFDVERRCCETIRTNRFTPFF